MKKRTWGTAVLAVLLTLSLVLCSCSKISLSPTINSAEIYGYFDTATKISSYALDKEEEFNANVSQISSVLEHWHRLLDIYNEYDGIITLEQIIFCAFLHRKVPLRQILGNINGDPAERIVYVGNG